MKKFHLFLSALALMAFVACGDDENEYSIGKGKETRIESDPRQESGPDVAKYSLEFPALKGGKSEVIVHEAIINSTNNKQAVNYCLEWDHDKKATRWVCYQMYKEINSTVWNRKNWANGDPWDYDPYVPQSEQQATYNELSKSTPIKAYFPNSDYYQKGHILASADRLSSKEANRQTFYMTNIYPMVSNFNENIWASMENKVRAWAKKADTLFVCKGGTIDKESNIIERTKGNHIVPKYFYMALLSKSGSNFKAMAFWIQHQDNTSWNALKSYAITVAELERKTDIDFFCNLPNDVENEVENVSKSQMLTDWGLN